MARGSFSSELTRIGFANARRLLIVVGLVIVVVLAASLWVRSVDSVEVAATLLYFPVFVGLLFYGVLGGAVMAVAATAVYVALRADAIDAVGLGEVAGLVTGRGMAYLLFGLVGGWAAVTFEESLHKLDRFDAVDDLTGLGNARALRAAVELERARSARYESVFSASMLEFDAAALPHRNRRRALRALGRELQEAARTVDHVAHEFDGSTHRLAAVLPETPASGAAVFHDRFAARARAVLVEHGADAGVQLTGRTCTVPGDEERLTGLLAGWSEPDPQPQPV